jgi:hypothetical protein
MSNSVLTCTCSAQQQLLCIRCSGQRLLRHMCLDLRFAVSLQIRTLIHAVFVPFVSAGMLLQVSGLCLAIIYSRAKTQVKACEA